MINDEPLLFDAYSGFETIAKNFKKLDLLYPNAVFIFIIDQINANEKESDNKYHLILKKYFLKRADKYLAMNIEETTDWKQLCKFLNCKKPSFSFPSFNSYQEKMFDFDSSLIKQIKKRKAKILEHDVHPWIIPFENLVSYGIKKDNYRNAKFLGTHNKILDDFFVEFNDSNWMLLEDSFPSNLAYFKKQNFNLVNNCGFKLTIEKEKNQDKDYISSSIVTRKSHLYGRFEVIMKPIKCDGIISAFFVHRNDPWQEIDFEFLGNDTTKALINVYYNPGEQGIGHNYGNRGTPILIDLNFDASIDFHEYAIEWEPHEIRWYVDNNIVHVRTEWEPTPIPDSPMQFFVNTWPSRAFDLVGNIDNSNLPQNCYIKTIRIYKWSKTKPIVEYPVKEILVNDE
ncbi:MAG: family 16 glycosylhydrolase [Bacteroidales bacterium]|jgi:beta-glucanase (GH16 family)|nr:family 16 glycosylhydrolase [Bacteroidales bacterium]